jgi:hypothetical protein
LVLNACNKNRIIGKWTHKIKHDGGDIIFNPDSTYLIEGFPGYDPSKDTVAGWSISGPIRRKWKIEKNNLLLQPGGLTANLYITYEIIQLTNKQLVLLSSFDKGDTTKYIIYYRDQ